MIAPGHGDDQGVLVPSAKPNVLLIVIDQFRGDLLQDSPLGRVARLPRLSALCDEATRFERHFSVVSPCGPSRVSLLTGQYAMTHGAVRNGTPLRHDTPNLAKSARVLGYRPRLFGYTDTAQDPRVLELDDPRLSSYEELMPGFDEDVRMRIETDDQAWREHCAARGVDLPPYPQTYRPDGDALDDPAIYAAEDSDTAFLTDSFLDRMAQAEPGWFATLTYIRPHPPLVAPAPYNRMFAPGDMPAARAYEDPDWHPYLAPARARQTPASMVVGFPDLEPSEATTAQLRALYLGLAAEVDHHIGRIVDWLKDSGQWDDTLLIVTADHGEMLGDYGLWGKGTFHDAAFHVPLIIRDPARPQSHGKPVSQMTESIDVAVTILKRAGGRVPDTMTGQNLLDVLDGAGTPNRITMSEYDFGNPVKPNAFMTALGTRAQQSRFAVLRDGDARLVEFASGHPPVLFDLSDRGEDLDIAAQSPARHLELTQTLLRHRMMHTDAMFSRTLVTSDGVRTGTH